MVPSPCNDVRRRVERGVHRVVHDVDGVLSQGQLFVPVPRLGLRQRCASAGSAVPLSGGTSSALRVDRRGVARGRLGSRFTPNPQRGQSERDPSVASQTPRTILMVPLPDERARRARAA